MNKENGRLQRDIKIVEGAVVIGKIFIPVALAATIINVMSENSNLAISTGSSTVVLGLSTALNIRNLERLRDLKNS